MEEKSGKINVYKILILQLRMRSHLDHNQLFMSAKSGTVKILKFGTPQTIAIIVLKIEKFDVTLH